MGLSPATDIGIYQSKSFAIVGSPCCIRQWYPYASSLNEEMKKLQFFGPLAAVILTAVALFLLRIAGPRLRSAHDVRDSTLAGTGISGSTPLAAGERSTATAPAPAPTLDQRKRMSDSDRLRCLEELGRVPPDADRGDWSLAGNTTWWGKPPDPKQFWKGKVLWYDQKAIDDALAHGRDRPPIPYDEATLARLYPAIVKGYPGGGKTIWGQPCLDSLQMSRYGARTDREDAFWIEFMKTNPHPPDDIERVQVELEETALSFPIVGSPSCAPATLYTCLLVQ